MVYLLQKGIPYLLGLERIVTHRHSRNNFINHRVFVSGAKVTQADIKDPFYLQG